MKFVLTHLFVFGKNLILILSLKDNGQNPDSGSKNSEKYLNHTLGLTLSTPSLVVLKIQ